MTAAPRRQDRPPGASRSLTGLAAALLPEGRAGGAGWHARVPARLDAVVASMPLPARTGMRAAAGALDGYAVARTGRRLADLSVPERESVVGALGARPALLALLDVVKVPVLLAAGTERMVQQGLPAPAPAREDPPLDCTPSDRWPARSTADAVVVGSGAGGAMAARTLARGGLRVVVLEEGRHHSTASFGRRAPLDRFTELYRDGGATVALGRPPLLLPTGRAVGGTTVVNAGTCYRTPEHVLARWAGEFGFAPAADLGRYLDEAERTLQVAAQPTEVLGANGRIALAGARELGWQAAPLRRNAPGCKGSCQCVVGCPTGAKQSVQLSVLPAACAAGARIVTGARVLRILVDPDRPGGPRAAGVRVAREGGGTLEILAPLVVVAAGALQTPPLLRRSGLGGHPRLGRNLSVHPATSVAGRFAEPVTAWEGVLQSVGVEELHGQGVLIEATATPPGMGSFVLPGVGRELSAEADDAHRLATLGAMVADLPSGRVLGRDRALVRYDLAPRDADRLLTAVRAMGRLLLAAGAREVLTGIPRAPRVRTLDELDAVLGQVTAGQLHLSAYHPTGTAAAGADPRRFPADPAGRLRGVHGVLIADASLLPGCPEVNPQLSIMAAAHAVADLQLA
ncbi:GMC family oxidoreductase N-terminal domain-containing protein [Actinacidiphila bryophytorum]|uniref:Choline dehydrogenase-like flavoprotein n=1 Tax=Actinacidiphila bryophytorum TaxID=1436133 RepID=A0A9W4GYN4_9ACTN|nr:GMC family oxidoreductase N-terminal domain-containing protein [Actinacidiphila bryophytorum]MBM9438038.1 GMC family oxidoreductase N-terminal domain-containing protein [Actinacidiphila bryophytorum]CAG7618157.1 Choline dehydrogenase-like flavoprotein [Actinacidiphila bryophytorum]